MKKRCLYGAALFSLALAIPCLLVLDSVQGRRFASVEREVAQLEKKQVDLVENNRKLITGISVLSSSDRIEKYAEEELGMRKAASHEIVRIEMKGRRQ
jgi:cell division protein FtsL